MQHDAIAVAADGSTTTVAVTGELDLSLAGDLAEVVERTYREGATTIVVDLAGVEFIDSSGLQGLTWLGSKRDADQELLFQRPSEAIERLFEMTGLTDRFTYVTPAR